jgi:hypothetical protein
LEQLFDGGSKVVEMCALAMSTTTSLGGVVQRGLDVRRVVMDSHIVEAFVWCHGGIDDRFGKGYTDLFPKDGLAVAGGDDC